MIHKLQFIHNTKLVIDIPVLLDTITMLYSLPSKHYFTRRILVKCCQIKVVRVHIRAVSVVL